MIQVDLERCIGCGICAEICPFGAIRMVNDYPEISEDCTLCGGCVYECPCGALQLPEEKASVPEKTNDYRDIWVWLETSGGRIKPVGLELLGAGRELVRSRDEKLVGILIGHNLEGLAETAIAHGADRIWRVDSPQLAFYETGCYTSVVTQLARQHRPSVILFGATPNGRDLAPRVAARLITGLTADCTGLAIDKGTGCLLQTRPAFGGNIMATVVTPSHRPQLATVRPGVMRALTPDYTRCGEILDWSFASLNDALTRILRQVASSGPRVKFEEANVIVAGGRGTGGSDGLKLLQELAEVLGGALAVSRAPVDEGWISPEYQVGQTGKTVAPKLYIACGISGTIQHLVGMQGAEVIVAINKDPKAPIFKVADYGLVGNLFDIVPRLVKLISARKTGTQST